MLKNPSLVKAEYLESKVDLAKLLLGYLEERISFKKLVLLAIQILNEYQAESKVMSRAKRTFGYIKNQLQNGMETGFGQKDTNILCEYLLKDLIQEIMEDKK